MSYEPSKAWTQLAPSYEAARQREDSLDRLLDWPCQRELIGDVTGASLLDLGCGSGAKAIALANEGAARVVGLDISPTFIDALQSMSTPSGTSWICGDIERLQEIPELEGEHFDIITLLCSALGPDRTRSLRAVSGLLAPGGVIVMYMAHPLRFSLQRSLREDQPMGRAYFDRTPLSYSSAWDPEVTLADQPKTFSDVINSVVDAGLYIERSEEPELAEDLALQYPHKRQWLDENVGSWGLRLKVLSPHH
jgi:SAM-dependent methyltransferase